MADVTQLLDASAAWDPRATVKHLAFEFDDLRKLAAVRVANERPAQTFQATVLVRRTFGSLVPRWPSLE
jgi:hypothetical protein